MTDKKEFLDVSVWRGMQDGGAYQHFQVPAQDNQTVLDVVSWIQHYADPTLTYRYACRVGMCGSCAMMVNGEPRWTCRTHVKKVLDGNKLTVGPLRNLPVIKDLVADLDTFFDKWIAAEGFHHPSATRNDPVAAIAPEVRVEGIECINCAVCYAACDTVTANDDYLGPAALQRAWTLYNDSKDADKQHIQDAVSGTGGCHSCHSIGNCTAYCPNDLDPLSAIAGLKRETAKQFFKGRK